MAEMIEFPFSATEKSGGISFPYLPLILTHQENSLPVSVHVGWVEERNPTLSSTRIMVKKGLRVSG